MKISALVGILLLLSGIVGLVFTWNGNTDFLNFGTRDVSDSESVRADEITAIVVENGSGNIVVETGETNDVQVHLNGRASERFVDQISLDVQQNGSTVTIEPIIPRMNVMFGISIMDLDLHITVPEKLWDNVEIRSGSGNLSMSDLSANRLNISLGSGNVKVNQVNGESIAIRSGSGDQTLEALEASEVRLEGGSGNITLNGFQAERLSFKLGSGNVKMYDGEAELEGGTVSGNVLYENVRLQHNAKLWSSSGNVKILLDEAPTSLKVDLRTGSGNSRVNWDGIAYEHNDDDDVSGTFGSGDVRLEVKTVSGNITLGQR